MTHPPTLVDYGREAEAEIARLAALIARLAGQAGPDAPPWLAAPRFVAICLLEGDPHMLRRVEAVPGADELLAAAREGAAHLKRTFGDDADILIADRRYGFINGLVREAVTRPPLDRRTRSDRLDAVLTHPLFGLPVFALVMWLLFQMTTAVSAPLVDWIDGVINGALARWAAALIALIGLGSTWVESLIVEGIIAGVGGVLVFLPVLAFMYLFIAVLEDSGYMARAAFLMDRFMHLIGLHGKSFIPMLLGFGCSVPGIYATRTLEDERDRILTGLLVPFMSCGARLPVYMLIGAAFFGARAGTLVFALYLLGMLVAVGIGLLLRRTLFREGEQAAFVIELPPYRLPALRGLLIHTWERTRAFVRNASTVILGASVAVWLLLATPAGAPPEARFAAVDAEHSALAALSRGIAPALQPAGFGTWQAASALATGFVAKEVIVSTLSVVYVGGEAAAAPAVPLNILRDAGELGLSLLRALGRAALALFGLLPGVDLAGSGAIDSAVDPALVTALRAAFTPLSAVAFCVFVLLTAPCMTTLAAQRHEFGARWMVFALALMLLVAWVAAVIVYQGGLLLGLGS